MPHFVFIGRDAPDALERRKATRPAHLEHWSVVAAAGNLLFAGPLLENDSPIGSLIIFQADSPEAARELTQADPYIATGVFHATELHPTKQVLP